MLPYIIPRNLKQCFLGYAGKLPSHFYLCFENSKSRYLFEYKMQLAAILLVFYALPILTPIKSYEYKIYAKIIPIVIYFSESNLKREY